MGWDSQEGGKAASFVGDTASGLLVFLFHFSPSLFALPCSPSPSSPAWRGGSASRRPPRGPNGPSSWIRSRGTARAVTRRRFMWSSRTAKGRPSFRGAWSFRPRATRRALSRGPGSPSRIKTADAPPKPNPPPHMQREEWVALERALSWGTVGAVVGTVLAWLVVRWLKRPRPTAPPPPPRPPWAIALERLDEEEHAGLLETKRFAEFFARVNDAVRECLGTRFGFDGLESTTYGMLAALRRIPHFRVPLPEGAAFLQDCDLVKFADVTPTLDECERALVDAEKVVRATMAPSMPAAVESREARP